jgi:membrane protein YdbS with pleckstrin-like domain
MDRTEAAGRSSGSRREAALTVPSLAIDSDARDDVLLETRPHVAALGSTLLRSLLLVLAALVAAAWLALEQPTLWRAGAGVAATVAGVAALRALRVVWRWDHTRLAVTESQLVVSTRGVRTRTLQLPLGSLQELSVDQTLAGRLLGYGTLVVRDAGGRRGLAYVPHPAEVSGLIMRLRQ